MLVGGCHIISLRAGPHWLPSKAFSPIRPPEDLHDGTILFAPENDIVLRAVADVRGIAVSLLVRVPLPFY